MYANHTVLSDDNTHPCFFENRLVEILKSQLTITFTSKTTVELTFENLYLYLILLPL